MKKNKILLSTLVMLITTILSGLTAYANEPTKKLDDGTWHKKARSQENYATKAIRFVVPDDKVDWNVDLPGYSPLDYTDSSPYISNAPGEGGGPIANAFNLPTGNKWADGLTPLIRKYPNRDWSIYYKNLDFETRNGIKYPLNPFGRTGMIGRGLTGLWGGNNAADPIVTRINPSTGDLEILLITRGDTGDLAFPGGIVEPGERLSVTAKRELKEETGIDFDFEKAVKIYEGYADDPRNTDNAWLETVGYHDIIPEELAHGVKPTAGDDAVGAGFRVITEDLVDRLYANHSLIMRKALQIYSIFEAPRRITAMLNAAVNSYETHYSNLMHYAEKSMGNNESNLEGFSSIMSFDYGKLKSDGSSSKNSRGLKLDNNFAKLDLGGRYVFSNGFATGLIFYASNLDGKFSLAKPDIMLAPPGKSKIRELGADLFLRAPIKEKAFVTLIGGAGKLNYETKRDVKFVSESINFKGKARGYRYHAGVTGGVDISMQENITIQPLLGFTYNRVTLDKYHENDKRNINVYLNSARNSLKTRVGAKISKEFKLENEKTFTPYAKASYAHELMKQPKHINGTVTSKKIKKKYDVDSLSNKGLILAEVGANYSFSEFVNVGLSGQTSVGAKYSNIKQLNLSMNMKF